MRQVFILLASIAIVAALEGARQLWRWSADAKREELRRRLRALGSEDAGGGAALLRQGRLAANPALDALLRRIPVAARLERLLEQADVSITVAQLLGWTALAACAGVIAAGALRLGPVLTTFLATLGLLAPAGLLLGARERRSRRLSEQLPDALDMMSRSLRAGHALTSAFEVVASEMPEPVAVEFGRAFEAQRLGLTAENAIVQMTERAPGNRDLKIFAVSVLIQRETGGNLAELLGNIADTIRARYRFFGKLRALTAEGRASGLILAALPFIAALVISTLRPGYLLPLVQTPSGHVLLAVGCAIWLLGVIWLYRLTKVDF